MKGLLLLAVLVLAINANPSLKWFEVQPAEKNIVRDPEIRVQSSWEEFKLKYSKSYDAAEEKSHFKKFSKNLAAILQHNSEEALGKHTYQLGLNEYADMDIVEVSKQMNGYKTPVNRNGSKYLSPEGLAPLPSFVDWSTKGYVTPVKNQGQCGSCWAFSTTGSLEGQHFKSTKNLVSLSEENLVDCTRKLGNYGCNGGYVDKAFNYIRLNGGIDTEKSYPYGGKDGLPCRFKRDNVGATVTGYVDLPHGNEQILKEGVATVGPISVAIDASNKSFQLYRRGVYVEPRCSTERLDHAVLVVGYGTQNGQDYWLVKNSWGATWGDNGYIKMARNRNNQCGIASAASYPLV